MMDYFDEINAVHSLFLKKLREPCDNQLLICLQAGVISCDTNDIKIGGKTISNVRNVEANGDGVKFELFFKSYAVYNVSNESYTMSDEEAQGIGKVFRLFSESPFLDFIRDRNTMEFVKDSRLKHYQIICENHIIDVLSLDDPLVAILS